WGSLYLSWEWYASFEKGDKRRDASCVTGAVPEADLAKYGIEKSATNWGYHPYLQIELGKKNANGNVADDTQTRQFHFNNGEYAPAIWSTKFWRNASAEDLNGTGSWGWCMWSPTNIYWKRYANVLIDYAECCFILDGGDSSEGWSKLDEIRARAFGNKEVGINDQTSYVAWFNTLAEKYGKSQMTSYPIPFNTATVNVTPAKEYYTAYAKKNIKGKAFNSPVWKVAVNEERRKEFNCEWCLRPDMQRSGFMADHIATNYPKDNTSGDAYKNYPWTYRDFDYNELKMDMPIPQDEIDKNPLCDQNPAYRGGAAEQ
ncbi:MAG: RagB/SusD family nutrient uptake outer membrane protein, partial [Bacteroidaceae bacterium]|nr:RagB/SusD family nutrient uptake outer membrane protein [Bacteroidaceae bacterium]